MTHIKNDPHLEPILLSYFTVETRGTIIWTHLHLIIPLERSLEYTTNARYCLAEKQPTPNDRDDPWPVTWF